MNDDTVMLKVMLDSYDDSRYPSEFISEYTMTECLAERGGVDTFLVQDGNGEKMSPSAMTSPAGR